MDRIAWIVVALLLGWTAWHWGVQRPGGAVPGPTLDIRQEPFQEALAVPLGTVVERGGRRFLVEMTHRYEIQGRVLSAESYSVAWTSDFYDVDLGLLWGDRWEDLLERYRFHQDGRWLFWRTRDEVSDEERAYVTSHVANQHLIPREGSRRVDKAIRWADKGDLVRIRGYLVGILDDAGQEVARSSTVRSDSGNGACEIVWVEEIQIGGKVYR